MSEEQAKAVPKRSTFPASVVGVLNKTRIVINRGSDDDVDIGDRFLLYSLSDEDIHDPQTGAPLGRLEIPKGTGEVINVQEHMATIESDNYPPSHKVIKRGVIGILDEEHITPSKQPKPFENPKVKDLAKPI